LATTFAAGLAAGFTVFFTGTLALVTGFLATGLADLAALAGAAFLAAGFAMAFFGAGLADLAGFLATGLADLADFAGAAFFAAGLVAAFFTAGLADLAGFLGAAFLGAGFFFTAMV
jgi:hypothetical protein